MFNFILTIFGTILHWCVSVSLTALAIMLLWNWFMPMIALGIMPIGYWHAFGLDALFSLFLIPPIYPNFKTMERWEILEFYVSRIKLVWGTALFAMGSGYIVYHYLM